MGEETKHPTRKNELTLEDYILKGKTFVIPYYQRGYVWGKGNKTDNAVDYMLTSIENGFEMKEDIFLQGITVTEDDQITLIDGQQRTTFLYLLLCYLGYNTHTITIEYEVRQESQKFLTDLQGMDKDKILEMIGENENEQYQDLYFFKHTLRSISKLKINEDELLNYLLKKIKFLYINIPADKATKTFTMMNGSKAVMLEEELIKAEFLRLASQFPGLDQAVNNDNWEINALRSRYAREWDKWLYWWSKEDVRKLFKSQGPLGWLLKFYLKSKDKKVFDLDNFNSMVKDEPNIKLHFNNLRRMQKSFEDVFNNPRIYNSLGIALQDVYDEVHQYKIIKYFITNKCNVEALESYAKWRVVGATHDEITSLPTDAISAEMIEEDAKTIKAITALQSLSEKFVYAAEGDNLARKYLLYLNVLEDSRAGDRGRKFNFSIYDNQSLEHIHPKSKAYHKIDNFYYDGNEVELGNEEPQGSEWLNRDNCPSNVSEHSIGNLVLLEGKNNSAFGNKTFAEKKNKYFDLGSKFESRELLHTISVFAKEKWDMKEIVENQENIIKRFEQDYEIASSLKKQTNEQDI